jgi:cytochrome c5
VHEPDADGVPGGWLLAVLVVLVALATVGCSQAEAQEPQPTAQEQRLARGAARACEGLTPVFDNGSHTCHKEIP